MFNVAKEKVAEGTLTLAIAITTVAVLHFFIGVGPAAATPSVSCDHTFCLDSSTCTSNHPDATNHECVWNDGVCCQDSCVIGPTCIS